MIDKILDSKYEAIELNKILNQLTDGTHYTPQYTEAGVRFLSVLNVNENKICFDDTKFISDDEHAMLVKRCKPMPNDILLTKVGSIGRAAIIPNNAPDFSLFVSVALIKPNVKVVSPRYLCAYLNSIYAQAQFKRHLKGIGVPDLHLENIATTLIIYPKDIAEQELICENYYSAFDNSTAKLRKADELLIGIDEFVRKAIGLPEENNVRPMFFATKISSNSAARIDPEFHNPFYQHRVQHIKNMNHDTLGNIIEFSNETWNQADDFIDTFPYIEISGVGIKTNEYELTNTAVSDAPSRAKMIVRDGDILVSTTRPHRGAIATISCNKGYYIASTGFCVLRKLKREDVSREYLQWVLLNDYVLQQFLQRSSGGNYPAIIQSEIKNVVIPIPDKSVQNEIVVEATRCKNLANNLKEEAEAECVAAKKQFEKELLGIGKLEKSR